MVVAQQQQPRCGPEAITTAPLSFPFPLEQKACLDNLYHDPGVPHPTLSFSTHISPTTTQPSSPTHRNCVTRPSSIKGSPTNNANGSVLRPASVPTSPVGAHGDNSWVGLFNLDPELPLQGVYDAGAYFSPGIVCRDVLSSSSSSSLTWRQLREGRGEGRGCIG